MVAGLQSKLYGFQSNFVSSCDALQSFSFYWFSPIICLNMLYSRNYISAFKKSPVFLHAGANGAKQGVPAGNQCVTSHLMHKKYWLRQSKNLQGFFGGRQKWERETMMKDRGKILMLYEQQGCKQIMKSVNVRNNTALSKKLNIKGVCKKG